MSAAMCMWLEERTDAPTNRAASEIWLASVRARLRAQDEHPVAREHAYRIELLYRALVVVMARRAG